MAGDTIKKVIDLSVNSKEVQKSYKELQRAFDKFQDRLNKTLGNEAKQAAKALNDLKTRLRVEQDILRLEKELTKETERQRENNRRSLEDTKARAAATVKNIESLTRLDFGGLIKNNIVRSIQEATKMRVRSIKDKTAKRVEGISSRYDSLIGIQEQGKKLNLEKIGYYEK